MARHKQGTIRVSVILPVYNHDRWVGEAIRSVLAQTFTDFELIIIDDASQDGSWEVIQAVCEDISDAHMTAIRHSRNLGAPAAINEGLQQARGEYLGILNSDDVWEPSRLARLVSLAEAEAADFMATDVAVLDTDSHPKEAQEPHWVSWFEGLKQDYADHADIQATLLRGNCLITTSNFFFHRRVFERIGGFADWRYVHDYEYVLRVLQAGFDIRFLSGEKLLGYRLHDANTIREKPLAAIEENMRLLLEWLPRWDSVLSKQRLQGLEIQLQDLYRYTREEWQTVVHERLQAKERELFPLIQDRDQWIAERDAVISGLRQQLEQYHQQLLEREQWVSDRDRWIAERDALLQQQQIHLRERDAWVADRDRWIDERDALIRRLQQEQQALLDSRAFRLGSLLLSPLRWFRQRFSGVSHA